LSSIYIPEKGGELQGLFFLGGFTSAKLALLRQSVYSRPAGYEDINDAE